MSLKDDLTDIQGVGDATADKILDVLDAHDTGDDPEKPDDTPEGFEMVDLMPDGYTPDKTDAKLIERAIDAAKRGDDRDAAVYLRRMEAE